MAHSARRGQRRIHLVVVWFDKLDHYHPSSFRELGKRISLASIRQQSLWQMNLPAEAVKLGEAAKIPFIGCNYRDSAAGRARGQKGIVGQTRLFDLFVTIFGAESSQQLSRESPIVKVRHEHPLGRVEIAFQTLDDSSVAWLRARV
jgi:hypothetical protein